MRMLITVMVVMLLLPILAGCSLNDSLTKVDQALDQAAAKVIATIGEDNVQSLLGQYNDNDAANAALGMYEYFSGETLSEGNKKLLKIPLMILLAQIRERLEGAGDGNETQ